MRSRRVSRSVAVPLLVLAAMAAAQQPDGDGELVGLWEFTYPGSGCVETMDFHADGNFEGRGGEEIYGGTWVLNPDASVAGRRRVDLEISHDNAMPDCQNYAWNDTGMSRSLYVVFPTGESLDFYEYGDGGQPLVTFVRSTTTED